VGRPTVAQSFAKFARRNRVLVAAAVLSTVALAVATGVSSYAFVREAHMRLRAEQNAAEAQRQTKKAQNTLKYLDALLSRAAALADGGANAEALRLALDEVTLEIPSFTDDPDLRETIVGRAAVIYRQIGYEDKAIPLLRIELEIAEKKYGPNARETTDILGRCARALSIQSQHQEAIKMAADTVRRRELEIQDEKSPYWLFVAKRDYADILKRAGRLPEALAAGRKLLNSAGPDIRSEDGWTFFVRSHAGALREAGRYEEAIGLLEETLAELALRTKGVDHDRSSLLMEEARVRRAMGNVPECARLLSLSIQAEEKAYGPNGRNLSALYVELSRPLDLQNQCEQAVNHCRHAVDIAVAIDDQAQALAATRALAENLENAGRFTESGEQWRAAARRGDALGRELYVVLTDLASAARAFARAGSTEEANKIAAEIDSKWSAISLKARAVSNRRLIRSALAYVAAADAARTGRPVPLDWRLTLHELAEEDLAKFETSLPAARDILARLRGGANPEGLAPPDASALLAFDRALNDRWSDFDKSGPWFHLAACCRLRSRPDLALQIYETVASWPKEEFRIASRRTLAQLHGAACLIQLSRSSEVKSIIESVRAEIDRDARLIPSPLAVAMVKALEAQIDLAGQKNSPD
jgi:tetratricopeptide (TPR) repeat protein